MSDKTLYDVLEVCNDAAPESIRAAYLHLTSRLGALQACGSDDALRGQRLALEEAYAVLGHAERRRKYDEGLQVRQLQALASAYHPPRPFPPALMVVMLGLAGGLYLYYDRVEEAEAARRAGDGSHATEAAARQRGECAPLGEEAAGTAISGGRSAERAAALGESRRAAACGPAPGRR